ncbi:MAG: FG-GAP-like repeat-containing protein [Bacteroidales bacterium]|nr:FG-GAP-like repeat-containing protein [Bacteroidales bacterium]
MNRVIVFITVIFSCIYFYSAFSQWEIVDAGTTLDLNEISFVNNNVGYISGGQNYVDPIVLKTIDGESFESLSINYITHFTSLSFVNESLGYVASTDGYIAKTIDGGNSWILQDPGFYDQINAVRFLDANIGFFTGHQGKIYKTTDGGNSWYIVYDDSPFQYNHLHFINNYLGFAAGDYGRIAITTDGGNSWAMDYVPASGNLFCIEFANQDVGYACTTFGEILKTTDGGNSWSVDNATAQGTVLRYIYCVNDQDVYISGDEGIIIHTLNGGLTWEFENTGTTSGLQCIIFTPSGTGYACGFNGTLIKKASFSIFEKIVTGPIVNDGNESTGTAWIDYNHDGYPDLFNANRDLQQNSLYKNNGDGTFTEITNSLITNDYLNSRGSTWADYNNDGYIDVFICNHGYNQLFKNLGDGSFEEILEGDIVNENGTSESAAWADYNNDGYVDLFVANRDLYQDNYLFHNNGDGTFTKVMYGSIVEDNGTSNVGTWADYDNNGFVDLFVANANYEDNFLYHNNGDGSFTKVTSGDIVNDGGISSSPSWGDFNNDGWVDLLVINYYQGANFLYLNNGDGTFTKNYSGSLVNLNEYSQCGVLGDVNNDGYLDILIANAYIGYPQENNNNRIYLNNGDATFSEFNDMFTTDMQHTSSLALCDYNGDGFVDVSAIAAYQQNNIIYTNTTNEHNWCSIKLTSLYSNASALGTKIRIKANIFDEDVWQYREVRSNAGKRSQSSLVANFGLGDAEIIDSLIVEWPSEQICYFESIEVNHHISINENCDYSFTYIHSEEIPETVQILAFPNPCNDIINLRVENSVYKIDKIHIYNLSGQLFYYHSGIEQTEVEIITDNFPDGIYFYSVTLCDKNIIHRGKLIVK